MAEAFDGFEERVDRAITDLEDALLGITDNDIRDALRLKGYETLEESQFRNFKDQLKDTLLDRLIEEGRHHDTDGVDAASESTSNSADFDITCSSYMKIGTASESREADARDLERLLALITVPSDDSHEFDDISDDAKTRGTRDQLTSQDDFLRANPEFAQSTHLRKSGPEPSNNRTQRRRTQSFTCDARKNDTAASLYRRKKKSFEDFVRHECRMQMDLITGPNQSVWVPTRPKCSPQVRYGQYKKIWEKFPIPGDKPRRELRWAIRNQMARKEEPQKQSWWPEVKSP